MCAHIVAALDVGGVTLKPMLQFASWATRANYHTPVELFTVNYDLVIETALEEIRALYFDGFVGALKGRFQTELVEQWPEEAQALVPATFVRLWKLHGSVNWAWTADAEIVRLGHPVTTGQAAAIYPSDTKYEESRRVPFVVLQDRLRRALNQPETLMLISGYSFADDHLNELLFDAATRRERSELIAFCFSDIPAALAEQAERTPNLQAVAPREAIIGGVRAAWATPPDPPAGAGRTMRSRLATSRRLPPTWRVAPIRTRASPGALKMAERSPTQIGRVRQVLGATVTVELARDLAGVAPIYRGRLQQVGQIGSLVRIPQGLVDLIATVNLVGIAELAGPVAPTEALHAGERWLQIQLLGEVDRGTGRFQRGVGSYPGLDDPVHFTTPDQLATVFPPPGPERLRIGRLAAAEEVPVCLDAGRLVTRHAAIVGSTGSGKTTAVAALFRASSVAAGGPRTSSSSIPTASMRARWAPPHRSVAYSVTATTPYASPIGHCRPGTSCGSSPARPAEPLSRDGSPNSSRRAAGRSSNRPAGAAGPAAVTSDTPVPFDLRPIWHQLEYDNRETR